MAGQLIDAEGKAFAKRLPPLQPLLLERLQAACAPQPQHLDADYAAAAPGWQEAYFLAIFVEKLFAAAPQTLQLSAADSDPETECWPREVCLSD